MKKSRFLPFAAALILASCVESPIELIPSGEEGEGLLRIGLSVDESLQIVQSKAEGLDESLVPHADSLYVDLYKFGKRTDKSKNETWNRVYFGKYEEAKDTTFRVNAGQWKLLAFHGDSTACGFDKPYFLAEKEFAVDGGRNENDEPNITYVEVEAKVSNVRITVNFDESVPGSFYDYFVRLARIDTSATAGNAANKKYKQILRYKKDQDKDAYMMPTDSLQIQFMAQYEYGDEDSWRFATLDTLAVAANDHLTIDLSVNPRHGGLDVNIKTDENLQKTLTDVEIPEIWAPQDAPQVVAAGFIDGDHAVVEGDKTGNGATISVVARGGLQNFFFKVDSEYLVEAEGFDIPLGKEFDLANPKPEDMADLEKLRAAGFSWGDNMLGSRKLTYLTMTDLFATINEKNPSLTVERNLATFTVKVVDEVGKITEEILTATAYPIVQSLSIPEGRVWANRIVSPKLTVSRGVSRLFMLQVSPDGQTWNDLKTFESADNSVIDFGTLDVLPDTKYYFRTIYNNNPNLMSEVVEVTTEKILQVGNPGFEDYHTTVMHVSPAGWLYDYDREWYLPYKEGETDPWWAVNSKKTMPDGHTAWTSNYCKNFPCTAYSTDKWEGEKSAMVYTINVGSANTDDTAVGTSVPGEIWIGTADDSGNHVSNGHAFASRPTSVKFMYRYAPINNETFVVNIALYDKDGNEIARSEKTDGAAASEWTACEIPVLYSNEETKAASIYISFKSSSSDGVKTAVSMEIAGSQKTAHIGSVLRVDNVELTY